MISFPWQLKKYRQKPKRVSYAPVGLYANEMAWLPTHLSCQKFAPTKKDQGHIDHDIMDDINLNNISTNDFLTLAPFF